MHSFLIALSLFFFTSCDKEVEMPTVDPPSNSLNKIMPLGASRVEGSRPDFESYRYELWKQLVAENFDFDYIGTQNDFASYPDFSNQEFDEDHEGRGGWTSGQIRAGITGWLESAGAPDIVLFSSPGGNDALQNLPYEDAVENINAIIDILQSANPEVTIILEQLAPARSELMTGELNEYFNRMQEDIPDLAATQSTEMSRVLTVNMFTDFEDAFLADDVHYNEAGARFIADRYFAVLEGILER